MGNKVKLLDCTLRDGGQGLEYLEICKIETPVFSLDERTSIANKMAGADIDIVELGCIVESEDDKTKFAIYQSVEDISKNIPERHHEGQLFVGLFIGPDIDIDKIPEHREGLVDGLRVILRYSELQKSLDFCAGLAKKGYKTFVQPMLTMRFTDDELELLTKSANEMGAYALYFVDSFGYMDVNDVNRLFQFYDARLNSDILIGFHAHNNMQLAYENVKEFLKYSDKERGLIVDSCAAGMGQGSGNMQTELIVSYMNTKYSKCYVLNRVLDVCDILEKFKSEESELWGYTPARAVSAINKVAYKYTVAMKTKLGMPLADINDVFKHMPNELKHRYSEDNLNKALELVKRKGNL